jgi:putative transposase
MANKRAQPEQIVTNLRLAEVLMKRGMSRLDAIRQIGVVEQTYWRRRYGVMGIDQLNELQRLHNEHAQHRETSEPSSSSCLHQLWLKLVRSLGTSSLPSAGATLLYTETCPYRACL